jgi:hypothetical protein
VAFGEGREVQVGVLRAYHTGVKGRQAYIYRIRKVASDKDPESEWREEESSSRSRTFTNLESGTQYELQIAVKSAAGIGGFSATLFRRPQ